MKKSEKQNKAIKYQIYPSKEQKVLICKTFGAARYVYNFGLTFCEEKHKAEEKFPGEYGLNYELTELKKAHPWLREVDATALTSANGEIADAFRRFFAHQNRYPKFRKKKGSGSYTSKIVNGNIKIEGSCIKLPKLGYVKARIHRMPKDGWKIKKATVSQDVCGRYFVAICFEYEADIKKVKIDDTSSVIGLDYKSDGLYMDSNYHVPDTQKYYRKSQKKLAHLQQNVSRKKGSRKGEAKSKNWRKAQAKVNRLLTHIANQRLDTLHKISTEIANRYDVVCVESLNMRAMSNKGFRNGKATLDNGYGIFLSLLEYKLNDRGKYFVKVDKWFASSQICYSCGNRQKLSLDERTYICPVCGNVIDRDYQAALNIRDEGLRILKEQLS